MLNGLWAGMMLVGILWAAFHGNLAAVTEGALNSAKDAVNLCITMMGMMSFWNGILKIGESAGLIEALTRKMKPIMHALFPNIPKNHPSLAHISTNMIANMLGLGWAATPSGLRAMQGLQRLKKEGAEVASHDMCMFLVINISSLQLIPMNMIAYRSEYGSVNATAIVAPALIATTANTIAAILFGVLMRKKHHKGGGTK